MAAHTTATPPTTSNCSRLLLGPNTVPSDIIQREILPSLDAVALACLSTCSRGHRAALVDNAATADVAACQIPGITNDGDGGYSNGLWQALHLARWHDGNAIRESEQRQRQQDIDNISTSSTNEGYVCCWYAEYARRHVLDKSVLSKLRWLYRSQTQHTGGTGGHPAWNYLMSDGGRDITDVLKYIISLSDSVVGNDEREQRRSDAEAGTYPTNEFFPTITSALLRIKSELPELGRAARSVLVGINRMDIYQKWRVMIESDRRARVREGAGGGSTRLDEEPDLEDGAVLLARFYLTSSRLLQVETLDGFDKEIRDSLDKLAARLSSRLEDRYGPGHQTTIYPTHVILDETKSLFFQGSGDEIFAGNETNYYDHRNSLLDHILETRRGIPITLAILFGAIVRRATGLVLDPIGLPGHFVLGTPIDPGRGGERCFIDAFRGGDILTLGQVKSLVGSYNVIWDDHFITPVPYEEVWQRMIRNLHHCHSMQESAADWNNAADIDADASSTYLEPRIDERDEERAVCKTISIPLQFLISDALLRITRTDAELLRAPPMWPRFCDV